MSCTKLLAMQGSYYVIIASPALPNLNIELHVTSVYRSESERFEDNGHISWPTFCQRR